MMIRCFVMCCLLRPAWTFDGSADTQMSSRRVRGRRRTYGINDFNLFVDGPSEASDRSFDPNNSASLDMASLNDLSNQTSNDSWSGSASAKAIYYHGSTGSTKGSHSLSHNHSASYSSGGSKSKHSKKGSKSNKSGKLPPSQKVALSKGSKKTKAPHAAKKKVPPPKESSRSIKASKAHKSKGIVSPTLSPSPSMRPILNDMPTIDIRPSRSPPTSSTSEVSLAPYAILYSLELTRIPLDVEVNQVALLTAKYLANRFEAAYPTLLDLTTNLEAELLVSPMKPFVMNYTSIALFSDGNIPTKGELEVVLAGAFTQSGKDAYIKLLQQQLVQSNIFASTNDISFRLESSNDRGTSDSPESASDAGENGSLPDEKNGSGEDESGSMAIAGAASATAVAAIIIFAIAIHVSRKQKVSEGGVKGRRESMQNDFKYSSNLGHQTTADTAAEMTTCCSGSDGRCYFRQSDADDATDWTMHAMSVIDDVDENHSHLGDDPLDSSEDEACAGLPEAEKQRGRSYLSEERVTGVTMPPQDEHEVTINRLDTGPRPGTYGVDQPRVADLIKMFSTTR